VGYRVLAVLVGGLLAGRAVAAPAGTKPATLPATRPSTEALVGELRACAAAIEKPQEVGAKNAPATERLLTHVFSRWPGLTALPADREALAELMGERGADLAARLGAARLLLDLRHEEARAFIDERLLGRNGTVEMYEAAAALISYAESTAEKPDAPYQSWVTRWVVRLLGDQRIPMAPRLTAQEALAAKFLHPPAVSFEFSSTRRRLLALAESRKDPEMRAALIDRVRRVPEDRGLAVHLARTGDPSVKDALLAGLDASPGVVRGGPLAGLVLLRCEEVVPRLTRLAAARWLLAEVRRRPLLDTASELDCFELTWVIATVRDDDGAASWLAARLGKHATEVPEPDDAEAAAILLGALGRAESARPLAELALRTKRGPSMWAATEALAVIGGRDAVVALIGLLDRHLAADAGPGADPGEDPEREDKAYQEWVLHQLHALTGQSFGHDAKAWDAWLAASGAVMPQAVGWAIHLKAWQDWQQQQAAATRPSTRVAPGGER
jgi:hypothetical protein